MGEGTDETGMEVPTRSTVTSASVITLFSVAGVSFEPGDGIDSAATNILGIAITAIIISAATVRNLV